MIYVLYSPNTKKHIDIYYSKKNLNPNSFAYLPIHSYFPIQKKSESQFIRISSNSFVHLPEKNLNPNSFVYLPIHSYISPPKKIRTTNHSYIFQFIRISSKKKITTIHSYIFQFIRISSEKKLNPNSFVYLPIHSYIFQFIRIFSHPKKI